MGRGVEGFVLKLMGSKDFTVTVTDAEQITDHYRRVHCDDGGLLQQIDPHPTMWIRLWFDNGGKPHQRAYTVVNPNPQKGTFSLDFALHDGCAANWARTAQPGDTIEATVQGTGFTGPDPAPEHLYLIGDPASIPAINSLLRHHSELPATVWLETGHESDTDIPLATVADHHEIHWVPRKNQGQALTDEVRAVLPDAIMEPERAYVWIACEAAVTRTLASFARKELGLPKNRVHALGYWRSR
ncbi:siderophore-interacting protein [Haloglycomyces albus]|uniref:siderophore-interacting protein n=1 Tax=Haloglycomyces albus TaxID=526067 RepID=UPI0004A2632F|nr:siderophore-interacting protein [Haloglycomyces albus]